MEPIIILAIILVIITVDFFFDQGMEWLNLKSQKDEIPNEMKGFYDEEKYQKSQEYQRANTKFSFLTSTFSFILSFSLLYFGFFGWLDGEVSTRIDGDIWQAMAFFGVLFIVSDIINTPFGIYSTFVIEEKFGFNKTTPKTFITDKLKGYLLTIVIGGALGWVFLYLVFTLGQNFWIYFLAVIAVFMLVINMFYTSLILPLFNKLTPLEDGEIKDAIENYCKKENFPLSNIFVIDGSKRSKKSNAFFSGIGKKKKVVLYDTLIENQSTEELVAIFAHEVGHFKKKHIVQGYILSILQVAITLLILSFMIFNQDLSTALGGERVAVHLNLVAFGILYSPISHITGLLMMLLSRKNEFQADAFAAHTYKGEALQTALKKLSVDNLSNLYPHKAYVFFNYSHPPLLSRLSAIDREVSTQN